MILYVFDSLFKGFNSNESFGRLHQIWLLCNRLDLFCSLGYTPISRFVLKSHHRGVCLNGCISIIIDFLGRSLHSTTTSC